MFITHSSHSRNALGERSELGRLQGVNDAGLGLVVTQTTRFDPAQMRNRFTYWLEVAAEEMARQVRPQISEAGFDVEEDSGGRQRYKTLAISQIPFNEMSTKVVSVVANWSATVNTLKAPSALKTYGKMAGTLALSYALPWVGLSLTLYSMFGPKKKQKMAIPWADIYSKSTTFAQESTVTEESNRIIEEMQQTQQLRVAAVEKTSQEGARFQLPEGVIGIRRGALTMATKGKPVETRGVPKEAAKPLPRGIQYV